MLIDAIASATGWDGDGNFTVTYGWTNNAPPQLFAALNLDDPSIGEENGEINALGISVLWAQGDDGRWTATVVQDTRAPHLFIHAKVTMQGTKAVVNSAPVRLDGGLLIGGTRYSLVPYTTGGKTYLTLEAMQ